jgi:hypothetical protein
MKWMLASMSIAAAALAAPMFPAIAAGQYDGMWIVDAPPANQAQPSPNASGCDAVRIPFQVTGDKITGSLQRSPYVTGRVEQGVGPRATPITGTVQPDGTVKAQWQSYSATGKLSGENAEVNWTGECGPRVATGGRIAGTH